MLTTIAAYYFAATLGATLGFGICSMLASRRIIALEQRLAQAEAALPKRLSSVMGVVPNRSAPPVSRASHHGHRVLRVNFRMIRKKL